MSTAGSVDFALSSFPFLPFFLEEKSGMVNVKQGRTNCRRVALFQLSFRAWHPQDAQQTPSDSSFNLLSRPPLQWEVCRAAPCNPLDSAKKQSARSMRTAPDPKSSNTGPGPKSLKTCSCCRIFYWPTKPVVLKLGWGGVGWGHT